MIHYAKGMLKIKSEQQSLFSFKTVPKEQHYQRPKNKYNQFQKLVKRAGGYTKVSKIVKSYLNWKQSLKQRDTKPAHVHHIASYKIKNALDEYIAYKRGKSSNGATEIARKYKISRVSIYRYYSKWKHLPPNQRVNRTLLFSDDNKD